MTITDWISAVLLCAGAFFYSAGTVGLVRFPDVYTRLHALTKADNIGLGLTVGALVLQADSGSAALKLAAIWVLAILASATNSHLIARAALRDGIHPWRKP
jgi:multicomponent Na+:H+ antiporter subunit G